MDLRKSDPSRYVRFWNGRRDVQRGGGDGAGRHVSHRDAEGLSGSFQDHGLRAVVRVAGEVLARRHRDPHGRRNRHAIHADRRQLVTPNPGPRVIVAVIDSGGVGAAIDHDAFGDSANVLVP